VRRACPFCIARALTRARSCTRFWKAVGIVLGLTVLYNGVKFALWMMKVCPWSRLRLASRH
jgi:hypothetical protein